MAVYHYIVIDSEILTSFTGPPVTSVPTSERTDIRRVHDFATTHLPGTYVFTDFFGSKVYDTFLLVFPFNCMLMKQDLFVSTPISTTKPYLATQT